MIISKTFITAIYFTLMLNTNCLMPQARRTLSDGNVLEQEDGSSDLTTEDYFEYDRWYAEDSRAEPDEMTAYLCTNNQSKLSPTFAPEVTVDESEDDRAYVYVLPMSISYTRSWTLYSIGTKAWHEDEPNGKKGAGRD
ncbi:hypothetical protein FRC12_002005 [Ceratobasidium sp. 428]|nr:hypothetical protein FRC12_002005 [Ceratobasidium sp. 428]